MLVKDQLKLRMEDLDISVTELARRVQVSNQTVRHWLSGRNLPGKSQLAALEKALGPNFKVDFSGVYEAPIAQAPPPVAEPPVSQSVELRRKDAELFIMISQLSPELKARIWDLVEVLSRQQYAAPTGGSSGASAFGGVRHSTARPQLAAR